MPETSPQPIASGKLPRLDAAIYKGRVSIFWTHCVDDQKRGWLTPEAHLHFRETLLHIGIRYRVITSAYCFMPDHVHIFWRGATIESDQRLASAFFRKHTNRFLRNSGCRWQRQAYDHVLRTKDVERESFRTFLHYSLSNPVRAGLCETAEEYPYSGSVIPGYPDLNPFNERFWRIYNKTLNNSM